VAVTGIFVILDGMKSVLWTEAMHVPVLLTGSIVLLVAGLTQIGGLDALRAATSASFGFREIFNTAVILAIIAGIYIYFW
jgi:SSS family solute:Na+ symporter